jgi:hypothetical protein
MKAKGMQWRMLAMGFSGATSEQRKWRGTVILFKTGVGLAQETGQ